MADKDPSLISLTFELDSQHAAELMNAATEIATRRETSVELVKVSPSRLPSRVERPWKDSPNGYFTEVEGAEGLIKIVAKSNLDEFAQANGIDAPRYTTNMIRSVPFQFLHRASERKWDETLTQYRERRLVETGIREDMIGDFLELAAAGKWRQWNLTRQKAEFLITCLTRAKASAGQSG